MGRFDQYQAPRFFTEVNVPGYDVGKSVAKSRELKQKAWRAKQQAPPQAEPGPVTLGSTVPTTDTNKDDACPTFKIDL